MDISNILKQEREINKLSYPHLTTQLLNYSTINNYILI